MRTPGAALTDHGTRPVDVRTELATVIAMAREKGAKRIEAACLLALARLEELEAALLLKDASKRAGGRARTKDWSPDQRRELARNLARCRWDASTHASE